MRAKIFVYVCSVIVCGIFANSASAQQFVYPAKGQPPEQTDKDKYECYNWAKRHGGTGT